MNRINQTDQSRECSACPRRCGVDRNQQPGFCGMPAEIRLAKAALHPWEEPCISGKNGSGALFFCGCNLRCVFCQNRPISQGELAGTPVSPEKLRELMLRLRDEGACSINLVTRPHWLRFCARSVLHWGFRLCTTAADMNRWRRCVCWRA